MSPRRGSLKHLLQWLIAGSRGGVNRARIIDALKDEPKNANQICNILSVDYRTARHHLKILEKNRLITSVGERYGMMYFLSTELEEHYELFEEIWNRFGNRLKKEGRGVKGQ